MLASYTFNTQYQQATSHSPDLPNLRLLEGGRFYPDQFSPILINEYDRVSLRFFKWGMNPSWSSHIAGTKTQRLAPAEYVFRHPAFKVPILRSRCLIPADGYYLEKEMRGGNQTFKVSRQHRDTFCFAGIYDSWKAQDGSLQYAFSIITTPAKESMREFGLQTPLILAKQHEKLWLNPQAPLNKIGQLLYLPAPDVMQVHAVHELKETRSLNLSDPIAA